jgi:hypothetical protein
MPPEVEGMSMRVGKPGNEALLYCHAVVRAREVPAASVFV